MKRQASAFALIAALALAGCAEMGNVNSAADVTRFHLGADIARGEIAIEPADPADSGLQFARIAEPVARELTRLGWRVVPAGPNSEQVAAVRLEQVTGERRRRSGFSIGLGAGTGSYGRRGGAGVGVGGTIPVGGRGTSEIVSSRLSVRIQRRSDATVAWEGRAVTEARGGTELASAAGAADRLAEALFRDFPGESGRTIRVR